MPPRVLVLEDNREASEAFCRSLAAQGFAPEAVADEQEARDRFEEDPPEAIVCGLRALSSFDFLRQIKRADPYVVALVLAGRGEEALAVRALNAGADESLPKPVDEASLSAALTRHLARSRREREVAGRSQWPGDVLDHWLGRVLLDAPAALIHVDPSGRIRVANREASRLLGSLPEALIETDFRDLAAQSLREQWNDFVRRSARLPGGYSGEVRLHRGDGEWFPSFVTALEAPEEGHLILHIHDLSRQKAVEQQFQESRRLASLGRVVEGVAHEVRNPLVTIGGFARFLLKTYAGGEPRARTQLETIVAEVERLEKMVTDVEQYVRFARSRPRNFGPVTVADVVRRALEGTAARYPESGVTTRADFGAGPAVVYGVDELLLQLFAGLMENSYDAMPGGGTLDVRVVMEDGWVAVRVADTGVGISEEDLPEIFDPFFTSKTEGAGLGLAKAHLIVEDHSGHIAFSSRLGEGTTCTVRLPMERRSLARGVS